MSDVEQARRRCAQASVDWAYKKAPDRARSAAIAALIQEHRQEYDNLVNTHYGRILNDLRVRVLDEDLTLPNADRFTDGQKVWRIGALMRRPDAWDWENEALDLAYSLPPGLRKKRALKRIADRMDQPSSVEIPRPFDPHA